MGAVALVPVSGGVHSACSATAPSLERCSAALFTEGNFWVLMRDFDLGFGARFRHFVLGI